MLHSLFRGRAIAGGCIALAAAAATALVIARAPASGSLGEGISSFSGNTSGSVVVASNSGTGTGVQALSTATSGGVGFSGAATGAGALGTHAKATGPSATGMFAESINTDVTHPSFGLRARSLSGPGIVSQTSANAGTSTSEVGVLGQDLATPSPSGTPTNNVGVEGTSLTGTGVIGISTKGSGVFGQTDFLSTSIGNAQAGVHGIDKGGGFNAGIVGTSTTGKGGYFTTAGGAGKPAVHAVQTKVAAGPAGSAVIAEVAAGTNPGIEIDAHGTAAFPFGAFVDSCACFVAYITSGGDMHITGHMFTAGGTLIATPTASGNKVVTYGQRASVPVVEDFGQAQLVNGQASVRIDPAFAQTVDQQGRYMVFLTPHGDNRGLYVAQESAGGFVVRESQGGRSTLAFDYRIVARPFASSEARLPLADRARGPSSISQGPVSNRAFGAYAPLSGRTPYQVVIPRPQPVPR